MDNIEKYEPKDQIVEKIVQFDAASQSDAQANPNLIKPILRRWRVVLLIFLMVCIIGVPAIWLVIKPVYVVTGAIKVAPILENIVSGEADTGEISNYQNFMNTQALMITSNQVVQRVADNLVDKELEFFKSGSGSFASKIRRVISEDSAGSDHASILKNAISSGIITAAPRKRTELMMVTMESENVGEAKQIVNAFVDAYMAVEVSSAIQGEGQKLSVLENELRVLTETIKRQRETIFQLGQEYGDTGLTGRRDMKLTRVASLLGEFTEYEARRVRLETRVELMEKMEEGLLVGLYNTSYLGTEELLQMRNVHINSDPKISILTSNVIQLEQDLIVMKQRLAPTNPELKLRSELIDTLNKRLNDFEEEAGKAFDMLMAEKTERLSKENTAIAKRQQQQELIQARAELEQVKAYEEKFREKFALEDAATIKLGRKQLVIQDLQEELALMKERSERYSRRIQELEMERKRPARVSIAYKADVAEIKDKRIKLTAAMFFGALGLSLAVAVLKDKADPSLHDLDDMARHVSVRIIGTTTDSRNVEKPLLEQQLADDYQAIRTNLGLIEGQNTSKILVITSPSTKDGKTTLSVNLALSFAQSGEKVLLIDGDLRKPDIASVLNIPFECCRLKDFLSGDETDQSIYKSVMGGRVHVLAAEPNLRIDVIDKLNKLETLDRIRKLGESYDRIIIDTPPVLAFSDALLWSKIADATILTTLASSTSRFDMKQAIDRLRQININILGTVLQNVKVSHGYHRYGYGYRYGSEDRSDRGRRSRKSLLLLTDSTEYENLSDS